MIRIKNIKINVENDNLCFLKKKIAKKIKVNDNDIINIVIKKKSIDARNKSEIFYVYDVCISLKNESGILKRISSSDVSFYEEELYKNVESGSDTLDYRPVVVGSGPCGLFAALILAENGYKPIVIERGEKIDDRVKTVQKFWDSNVLNPNSNVSFGEGGAGTFSDGKLNTLVNDKFCRIKKVFKTFIECGAPEEILYLQKPHIGTNVLRNVVKNLENKIVSLGGTFYFNSTVTDILTNDNHVVGVKINDKDIIDTSVLILAIGHSARDTFEMLYKKNVSMSAKPFAVGVRIQHNQVEIDKAQYGKFYKELHPASYKLTFTASNKRGVYSFCMCPGGYVVNASSICNHLAINGMSNHERDSENANSAIVVTVGPSDFGDNPMNGIKFQEKLENKAYELGRGQIPVQLLKDYKKNRISSSFGSVNPIFKGNYNFADLNLIFPDYVNEALKESMDYFDKKIHGFGNDDSILAGVESRTSSPVRIERDEDFVSNILGIYPAGEGAGYSGGITTSAVDGIKVAEKIIQRYKPFN